MEKINLAKILKEYENSTDHYADQDYSESKMLEFAKEVAKQTLQPAAENACGSHCTDYVDKQSILNVINLIE